LRADSAGVVGTPNVGQRRRAGSRCYPSDAAKKATSSVSRAEGLYGSYTPV
jgi:hypothetical protein